MNDTVNLSLFCYKKNETICWLDYNAVHARLLKGHALQPLQSTYKILENQLAGNFIYIVIGVIGIVFNALSFYIYASNKKFHYKSYYLLAALSVADFISCGGFLMTGAFRTAQYYTVKHEIATNVSQAERNRNWMHMDQTTCVEFFAPIAYGFRASIAMDFIISCDRLFAILHPVFHTLKLRNGYVAILIAAGFLRGVLEYGLLFVGMDQSKNSTWYKVPVCTMQDARLSNCFLMCSNLFSVFLVIVTVLNYLLTIIAVRYQHSSSIRNRVKLEGYSEGTKKYVMKCLRAEKRVRKVAIIIGISFLVSSLLGVVVSGAVECYKTLLKKSYLYAPFIFCFVLLDTADTFLITVWRDRVFRKAVLDLFSRWWHRSLRVLSISATRETKVEES